MLLRPLVPALLFAFAAVASGCGSNTCDEPSAPTVTESPEPGGIHGFASESALSEYVAPYAAQYARGSSDCASKSGGAAESMAATPSAAGASADAKNESITNNQEAGVDEGGIVKNVGDSLVVLRKGRLYVVGVAENQAPTLVDSMAVARSQSLNGQVWYDEMLVKGDLIYVIGYRYGVAAPGESVRGATEIDSFRLTGGKLTRLRSMFLESNDYYSARDYASRMVAGNLVFYMPHIIRSAKGRIEYPRVLEVDDAGRFSVVGPIFGALDVFTSLTRPSYGTFHTVVKCALPDSGALDCHGRSVIGSYGNLRYVSPDAVYLWTNSHVYRFDFASLDITAHKVEGSPLDQFSFRQNETDLLVATNTTSSSGGPGSSIPKLLRLPLSQFDRRGQQSVNATALGPTGSIGRNRFVGDVLLASVWTSYAARENSLVSMDAKTGATSSAQTNTVVRIEPLGDARALVVTENPPTSTTPTNGSTTTWSAPSGITLRALSSTNVASALGTIALDGVTEGEGRSHGFFYKPGEGGTGTFGYAVINPPEYGARRGFGNGISNLGFFDVAQNGTMASLGIVSSGDVTGRCETSCIDWYGNTRPIFLGGRTFALMGSELAEVSLEPAATKGAAVELK